MVRAGFVASTVMWRVTGDESNPAPSTDRKSNECGPSASGAGVVNTQVAEAVPQFVQPTLAGEKAAPSTLASTLATEPPVSEAEPDHTGAESARSDPSAGPRSTVRPGSPLSTAVGESK